MTATNLSYAPTNSTAAYFRDWGKKISDALAAGGLSKVWTDIDWSTVNPPAQWGSAGSEVWTFTDSLQATAPLFVRMNYGAAGDASYPEIQLGVGNTHNGSGTIGGAAYASVQCAASSTVSASNNWVSAGSSWVVMRTFNGDGNAAQFLSVERLHANDGSDAEGYVILSSSSGGSFYTISTSKGGTILANQNAVCSMPSSKASGAVGSSVATYPIRPWDPTSLQELPPMNNFLGYYNADMAEGNPIPVVCWDGVTRNYMPTGLYSQAAAPFDKGSSMYIMMRYE